MRPIHRSVGTTPSERRLAKLADRIFLDLWSYPNLYKDKKQKGKGQGQELYDLMVVFGDDVIIFSDKKIRWPEVSDIDLAWSRWFRAAISDSTSQIRSAISWLTHYPDRIFLDKFCRDKLPIELPPLKRRRVHGVIIATGASEALKEYCADDSGTFMIIPELKGRQHVDKNSDLYMPFAIGDVNPDGPYVHVFDETGINILARELDTITDFVDYLNWREQALRSEMFSVIPGEEELLAFYLGSRDRTGEPNFHTSTAKFRRKGFRIVIAQGEYAALVHSDQYAARQDANSISYVWDRLIQEFTRHVLSGTSVSVFDEEPTARLSEQGLRFMAKERRLYRRSLATQLIDTLQRARAVGQDRYARVVLPTPDSGNRDVAYIFLILAYPKFELPGGYAQYRKFRATVLEVYCMSVLRDHPELKYAVGLGFDAAPEVTGRQGGSEDLMVVQTPEWDAELDEKLRTAREDLQVYLGEKKFNHYHVEEFPTELPEKPVSRQHRRAMERAARKQLKRRDR